VTSEKKTWKTQIVAAAGIITFSSCSNPESAVPGEIATGVATSPFAQYEPIGAVIQSQMDAGVVPGALVMLSEKGQTAYFKSRGVSNLVTKAPIADDTIFRLFSMTKPITCAAVMSLHDDGIISLDDPVAKYIPEFADMQVRNEAGLVKAERNITLRHLMTHTSGLSYEIMPGPTQDDYRKADVFAIRNRLSETLEQHVKRLARMPLALQPGTGWNYGESMGVLGRVVEVASGKSYRTYLKEKVLDPLDMIDTDFFVPAEKAGRLAPLYLKTDAGGLVDTKDAQLYGGSYLTQPKLEYGGAGLVGTARDYEKFGRMLLNKGKHGDRRILSEDAVRMMTSNQLDASLGEHPLAASGRAPGVGFGFCGFVVTAMDERSPPGNIGEYGWSGWASTAFWIDPKRELVGLVFTQVIPETLGTITLAQDIHRAIYEAK
jgi:CubicO group peptidase (beta-lactamase class C family)